jgi:large subunit ribosomal protein L10
MPTPEKVKVVEELTVEFREATATMLTEYRGLTVAEMRELRVAMGSDVSYRVVKNKLSAIAAKNAGLEDFAKTTGPTAIAFVKGDAVEVAKVLRTFSKEHEALVIKGGYVDGAFMDEAGIIKLASLESREVLLAKLAGGMKASMSQAAALFQAPLSEAVRTVEALRAKVETEAPVSDTPAPAEEKAPETRTEAPEAAAPAADEAPAPESADVSVEPAAEEKPAEEISEAPAEAEAAEETPAEESAETTEDQSE